ncbi:MAG: DUF4314 domain-containing protein [Candidatus Baldrarchaeia archaeon]
MVSVGDRVELVYIDDPYTKLKPGDRGTVVSIDDLGTIHVKWDNGARLGLIPGRDSFKIIQKTKK